MTGFAYILMGQTKVLWEIGVGEMKIPGCFPIKDRREYAYFTVEAALILPVVICMIVMIMYMSFYLYDRCVMTQDCYVLGYRQSIEKAGRDRAGDETSLAQFKSRLFMLSGVQISSSGEKNIQVQANGRMEPPVFGLPLFDNERQWILGIEKKAAKTDPPKAYRRVRRILNLAAAVRSGN